MTSEQRLSQLENRCRLQSRALIAVVLVASLALLLGANDSDKPQKLRVTELQVVDGQGNVRIRLGREQFAELNVFTATFFNADGKPAAVVADIGQLSVMRGQGRASLSAGESSAGLHLSASGRRPSASLHVQDDYAALQLRDTNGKVSFQHETPRIKVPGPRAEPDPFALNP